MNTRSRPTPRGVQTGHDARERRPGRPAATGNDTCEPGGQRPAVGRGIPAPVPAPSRLSVYSVDGHPTTECSPQLAPSKPKMLPDTSCRQHASGGLHPPVAVPRLKSNNKSMTTDSTSLCRVLSPFSYSITTGVFPG